LLVFRRSSVDPRSDQGVAREPTPTALEVLIVHPGGPVWAKKDDAAWSIPKGEYGPEDDPEDCARREFEEELGTRAPEGPWSDLGEVVQAGGKRVTAWALEGDLVVESIVSNTFQMEWPPRSGRYQSFPEVDRAAWVPLADARRKLNRAQVAFLDRLQTIVADASGPPRR
jgi:predicted NUDIX family NTP pyrophosphohydrolase